MPNPYAKYVLPRMIEAACSQLPMTSLRRQYVGQATGDVLELGIGTGLNLEHYSDEVRSVTGVDPAAELTEKARERAETIKPKVEVLGISGESLPIDDNQFDTVVCTWTMCSIPNPYRAVEEMRRVLKPGGDVIFVEHGRADDASVVKWQRRIEPLWKIIGGGCHLTRRMDDLLEQGGFRITRKTTGYEPGPKFAAFMMHGFARKV